MGFTPNENTHGFPFKRGVMQRLGDRESPGSVPDYSSFEGRTRQCKRITVFLVENTACA